MVKNRHEQIARMALTALLAALVVVLQLVSNFVKIGVFSITLTLVPIVLGGALLGPKYGTALGFLFGVITFIFSVANVDVGGFMMFSANPGMTAVICLIKGTAAGFVSSMIYKLLSRTKLGQTGHSYFSTLVAAIAAPVVNTGLFLLGATLFFYPTLQVWAGGSSVGAYIVTGLLLINFLPELLLNIVLAPAIASVTRIVGKK